MSAISLPKTELPASVAPSGQTRRASHSDFRAYQPLSPSLPPLHKRFGAMAVILVLHGLFFYGFAHVTISERSTPSANLQVVLVPETVEPPPPDRALRVDLDTPTLSQLPPPEVQVASESPPLTAIAVTAVTTTPPQPAGETPKLISNPSYLRPPTPVYPRAARALRQSGLVVVRVLIDTQGRASEVKVDRSSGSILLDTAALEAVRKAIFKPYVDNDEPRAAYALVPIEFNAARGR